jgi:hypothetical protein
LIFELTEGDEEHEDGAADEEGEWDGHWLSPVCGRGYGQLVQPELQQYPLSRRNSLERGL